MLTQERGFSPKAITFCRASLFSLETGVPGSSQTLFHTRVSVLYSMESVASLVFFVGHGRQYLDSWAVFGLSGTSANF